jgi:4-hydroxybenzoate polyprenyltransferase
MSRLPLYLDLIRWNRPAGWLLLLWPSLSALWVASGGFPGWHLLGVFTLGTFLMRSAGCCINDVADRDFDRHVKRTAQRPVTRGALSVTAALGLGAALALAAFGLVLTLNAATVAWSFAALAVTLAYPYAKRLVSMPQAVLGVAFSFGIPMAFSAVQGGSDWSLMALWRSVPALAWLLLLGNLFWVLAYDTEYAMVDRDDDLLIGMKTSAITLGRWDVVAVLFCYGVYLALWSAALASRVSSGAFWLAIGVAGAQVVWHGMLIRTRSRAGCFKAFRVNHWLGFTVFAGIALALGACRTWDAGATGGQSDATQGAPMKLGRAPGEAAQRRDAPNSPRPQRAGGASASLHRLAMGPPRPARCA